LECGSLTPGQKNTATATSAVLITPTWTNTSILVEGLPSPVTSAYLHRFLPGVQISHLATKRRARALWCISCSFRSPSLVYSVRAKTIAYQYTSPANVGPDVVNLCLQLLELAADERPNCLMLHATFVSSRCRDVLLAGPPLAGKTSVAVQAQLSGWSCCAGERLLLDTASRTVLAGTAYHDLPDGVVKRFFPTLGPERIAITKPRRPSAMSSDQLRELIIVIPKVTSDSDPARPLRLSPNMAFRLLSMEVGTHASGEFFVNYDAPFRAPARCLDTAAHRKERGHRMVQLCNAAPVFLLEGRPEAIVDWLDRTPIGSPDSA